MNQEMIEAVSNRLFEKMRQWIRNQEVFPNKLLFDEQESADILGIRRADLKALRDSGEIVPKKIGARWYYTKEMLVEFANSDEFQNDLPIVTDMDCPQGSFRNADDANEFLDNFRNSMR